MKKRTKAIGGAVAAAAAATALIATNPAADKEVNINYDIHPINEYVSEMTLSLPAALSADIDIAELYLNGAEVDKMLLPNGSIKAIPLVFSDTDNLSIKLYRLGEQVGTVEFKDGKAVLK